MLKHPQHAELALLIDQGIVGDDGEVEMQAQATRMEVMTSFCLMLLTTSIPWRHLAEDGVDPVEVRLGCVADEELAAAGVLPGVRHRERPGHVLVGVEVGLALDLVAGAAGADARVVGVLRERIAALDHEVGDDPVEPGAVVELAVGELLEVR